MLKKFALVLAALSFSAQAIASTKYTIDTAHSAVTFKVSHLMISSVTGRFDKFEGDFAWDEKTGKVEDLNAKIDIDTINTNDAKRDAHLKNEDFFGVRPTKGKMNEAKRWMTFKATKADVKNGKPGTLTGDLTLNGVTKPVTLKVTAKGPIKDPWGNQKLGFEATGKLNRKDYGLSWNKALETGGVMVGDEIEIAINGEAQAATTTVK